MTRLLASVLITAILAPAPAPRSGYAARYRPGLMHEVARNRGMTPASCMVAATHEQLGAWLTVRGQRTGAVLTCLVVDVPAARDRAAIIRKGIVVELDHASAGIICGSTREPPSMCPVTVQRSSSDGKY